jgi:hypothetical protein
VLVGLIVAAGIGGILYSTIPSSYQSSAVATVVPPTFIPSPQSPQGTAGTNPFLRLDESINRTAYIVVAYVDTAFMHAAIADRTGGIYSVSNTELILQTAMPAIRVTGTASDPAAAKTTVDAVVAKISDGLITLQNRASVPGDVRLHLDVTVEPSYGAAVGSSRARSAAAGAAAVVLLTLVLALAVDTVGNRRSGLEQAAENASPAERQHPVAGHDGR